MDALITAVFRCDKICDPDDIERYGSFELLVRNMIASEGLMGIADLVGITKIEQIVSEKETQ